MEVVSITDGDTLKLRTDETGGPVEAGETITVRLIGIDTPEVYPVYECYGDEAEAELTRLAGETVYITDDQDLTDDYGRTLLYLWSVDGTFINLELVEAASPRRSESRRTTPSTTTSVPPRIAPPTRTAGCGAARRGELAECPRATPSGRPRSCSTRPSPGRC